MDKTRYRKPAPHLAIRFAGKGVYPEDIPIRAVADTLAAIHALATAREEYQDGEGARIRLLDVRRGSAVFNCVVADEPDVVVKGLRRAGKALGQRGDHRSIAPALSPLRRLSEIAQAHNCEIVVRDPTSNDDIIATIGPDSYETLARDLLVTGEKTLTGRVERVGGATEPKCILRVANLSRLLYCKVDASSPSILRDLAAHLYQDVVVTGVATWVRFNWRVVDFEIRSVLRPADGGIVEALEAIRAAGGSDWDSIEDPAQFLEEVSGKG